MIRAFATLFALSALFVQARAFAFCPSPTSGASDDVAQFFRAVTLADYQAQLGGYEVIAVTNAPSSTPFNVVYALRLHLSRLDCAESLTAPFAQSSNDNIAETAKFMAMSLQTLHWGFQRALDRVNATLSGKPPPEVQVVNDSAADVLKLQDAMNNLATASTMSALLIRGCDHGATVCNRILLNTEQRKDMTSEWVAMADPKHGDDIARAARSIVKMLQNPSFKSLPPVQVGSFAR